MIRRSVFTNRKIKAKITDFIFLTILVFSLVSIPGMASEADNPELMNQVFAAAESNLGNVGPEDSLVITDLGSPAESYIFLDSFTRSLWKGPEIYGKSPCCPECKECSSLVCFFDKSSGNCTYIEVSYGDEDKIRLSGNRKYKLDELSKNKKSIAAWNEKVNSTVFNGHDLPSLQLPMAGYRKS
jgi:formylmethanofuran dehydrogenase subunit E-like metal-binding protein